MQRLSAVWTFIKYPLVLAILYWLVATAWPSLQKLMMHGVTWLWLMLGLAVFQVAIMFFAQRFRLVLRASGIYRCYRHVLAIYIRSIIYFFITPGGIGVEAARYAALKDENTSSTALLSALLMDRIMGMFAAVVLGLCGFSALFAVLQGITGNSYLLLAGLIAGAFLVLFAGYSWKREAVNAALVDLRASYTQHRCALLAAFVCSVILQALMGVAIYCCARAIAIDVDLFTTIWVTAAGMVLMVLPVNAGGFGLNDAGTALLFHAAGLGLEDATALALLGYLLRLWSGVQSGLLELAPKAAKNRHG